MGMQNPTRFEIGSKLEVSCFWFECLLLRDYYTHFSLNLFRSVFDLMQV